MWQVIINPTYQLAGYLKVFYYTVVPDPAITILPAGYIQGAIVGSPQGIKCIVNTVDGVELSSVTISWSGPNGNFTTDNSRMIVNPVTSFGNNFTSDLHFIYLMEGDEGIYTCNVMILDVIKAGYVELRNLTCKYLLSKFLVIKNRLTSDSK